MANQSLKNVLWLLLDDWRNEAALPYSQSHMLTPTLDAFASSALTFGRTYCQQALCGPSRASFLSGRRPERTQTFSTARGGGEHWEGGLPGGHTWPSLPEYFKSRGWRVHGGGKIFHGNLRRTSIMWSSEPFKFRGYGACPGDCSGCADPFNTWCTVDDEKAQYDWKLAENTVSVLRRMRAKADADLRAGHLPGPFFVMAGFVRPHQPWVVPTRFWQLYDREERRAHVSHTSSFAATGAPSIAYGIGNLFEPPTRKKTGTPGCDNGSGDRYVRHLGGSDRTISAVTQRAARRAYFASITFVDEQMGKVLRSLDVLSMANQTLTIVSSDHGYSLGEHGMWHKYTNFELSTRTPLLIRAPWKPRSAGKSTEALVELVDLYPTIAALAGAPLPRHGRVSASRFDGRDVSNLFDEPSLSEPDCTSDACVSVAVSQYPRCSTFGCARNYAGTMGYTARSDAWRYTVWLPFANGTADWTARPVAQELYAYPKIQLNNSGVSVAVCHRHYETCDEQNVADRLENRPTMMWLHAKLCAKMSKKPCA